MSEHTPPITRPRTYFLIYLALLLLLAVTIAVAYLDLGALNPVLAVGIASVKAFLVILFFMGVRHSDRLTRVFVAAGFLWLALLIGLTLTDYFTRIGGTLFNP